jgi:hypothetical protein
MSSKNLTLKSGLLIVAVSWVTFTLFQFISGLSNYSSNMPWYIALTEILGSVGLGFRSAASFIAVIVVASYFFFKNISKLEALMGVKLVLILEALYFAVTFIPSAFFGVGANPFSNSRGQLAGNLVVNFLPCLVEGVLIPVALLFLYTKLNFNKPKPGVIKWALIAGTTYILAFWFTNTCNWIYAIMYKGMDYVLVPLNMVSFLFTTVGMLALTLYAGYFTKRSLSVSSWRELSFIKIGALTTLAGLYFAGIYLLWIIAGSVGGWSPWYAWFLGHNVDIWVMILPAVGLPLLLFSKNYPQEKRYPLSNCQ